MLLRLTTFAPTSFRKTWKIPKLNWESWRMITGTVLFGKQCHDVIQFVVLIIQHVLVICPSWLKRTFSSRIAFSNDMWPLSDKLLIFIKPRHQCLYGMRTPGFLIFLKQCSSFNHFIRTERRQKIWDVSIDIVTLSELRYSSMRLTDKWSNKTVRSHKLKTIPI